MNTLSSGYSAAAKRSVSGSTIQDEEATVAPRRHRLVAPPPTSHASDHLKRGRMLYSFQESGPEEMTVEEGSEIVILDDDGK
jgi:formin-binding protein 1